MKNRQGLCPEIERLRAELVVNHLVAPDHYVSGTFTLGADDGWREALERKKQEQINAARKNTDLRNNEVDSRERSIIRLKDRKFRSTPPENWNLYSVHITTKGVIKPGLQFAGQRKHPNIRTGEKGEVRFDCTGS